MTAFVKFMGWRGHSPTETECAPIALNAASIFDAWEKPAPGFHHATTAKRVTTIRTVVGDNLRQEHCFNGPLDKFLGMLAGDA